MADYVYSRARLSEAERFLFDQAVEEWKQLVELNRTAVERLVRRRDIWIWAFEQARALTHPEEDMGQWTIEMHDLSDDWRAEQDRFQLPD